MKSLEVTERSPEEKIMLAGFTAWLLVAVNPANVATPEEAVTLAAPPNVQEPAPLEAVTAAALVVTVLLY